MFNFYFKKHKRLKVEGSNIFIDNKPKRLGVPIELNPVFEFDKQTPEIKIYENDDLIKTYKIDTLKENPDLKGMFLHSSIIIQPNSAVMIDGIISKSATVFPKWADADYEGIRLQPFFLSNANENNLKLVGKGLFERGLHYAGTITPASVRNVCICDFCNDSFTLQHFHAGFSEMQYFYSSHSKETLIVRYSAIEDIPVQLQKDIDVVKLEEVERKLPQPVSSDGVFRYYNSFYCPHCLSPFIDFEKNKDIRPNEYYGNVYINQEPHSWPI